MEFSIILLGIMLLAIAPFVLWGVGIILGKTVSFIVHYLASWADSKRYDMLWLALVLFVVAPIFTALCWAESPYYLWPETWPVVTPDDIPVVP